MPPKVWQKLGLLLKGSQALIYLTLTCCILVLKKNYPKNTKMCSYYNGAASYENIRQLYSIKYYALEFLFV